MEYRRLGKSGLRVSALSLGSWLTFGKQISDTVAEDLMIQAYEAGVNFFDNAEIYAEGESERVMGRILKKLQWARSSYLISSKVYFGTGSRLPNQTGLSRKHVIEGCNEALKRFQTDYLDLYYCHRPDPHTPIEETVLAMNTLLQQGKILYWGTSEWTASEIAMAIGIAKDFRLIGPSMEQPQYNLFERFKMEQDYLRLFNEHGIGTTIWSPLASGILSGKYNAELHESTRLDIKGLEWLKEKNLTPEKLEKIGKLKKVADDLGISLPKLAIAWCLKNPNVSTVILGASKTSQLAENLTVLDVLPQLDETVMGEIENIVENKPVPSSF